jgi:hypothetical protein
VDQYLFYILFLNKGKSDCGEATCVARSRVPRLFHCSLSLIYPSQRGLGTWEAIVAAVRRPVDGSKATIALAPTPDGLIRLLFQLLAAQPWICACLLALFTHAFSAIRVAIPDDDDDDCAWSGRTWRGTRSMTWTCTCTGRGTWDPDSRTRGLRLKATTSITKIPYIIYFSINYLKK